MQMLQVTPRTSNAIDNPVACLVAVVFFLATFLMLIL
jgi:hypothetical protein